MKGVAVFYSVLFHTVFFVPCEYLRLVRTLFEVLVQ